LPFGERDVVVISGGTGVGALNHHTLHSI
jgi:molybdopterin biosynthesis enzyme MoaB